MALSEGGYFAAVNMLLADAQPIGAYCLAFGEVIRRETGRVASFRILKTLASCATVREGAEICRRTITRYRREQVRPGP